MSHNKLAAGTVAEHILCLRGEQPTTPLQVVKLVYLCHGWMLGLKDEPLIDEPIVTGQYGPVVQSISDRYKDYGDGPIDHSQAVDHSAELGDLGVSVLNFVHTVYEDYLDTELSDMTHEPGTPWSETFKAGGLGVEIPQELIANHYRQLIVDLRQADNG